LLETADFENCQVSYKDEKDKLHLFVGPTSAGPTLALKIVLKMD
jgi:hypothetical protein